MTKREREARVPTGETSGTGEMGGDGLESCELRRRGEGVEEFRFFLTNGGLLLRFMFLFFYQVLRLCLR